MSKKEQRLKQAERVDVILNSIDKLINDGEATWNNIQGVINDNGLIASPLSYTTNHFPRHKALSKRIKKHVLSLPETKAIYAAAVEPGTTAKRNVAVLTKRNKKLMENISLDTALIVQKSVGHYVDIAASEAIRVGCFKDYLDCISPDNEYGRQRYCFAFLEYWGDKVSDEDINVMRDIVLSNGTNRQIAVANFFNDRLVSHLSTDVLTKAFLSFKEHLDSMVADLGKLITYDCDRVNTLNHHHMQKS